MVAASPDGVPMIAGVIEERFGLVAESESENQIAGFAGFDGVAVSAASATGSIG